MGVSIRSPVLPATAGEKCLRLWVRTQSGRLLNRRKEHWDIRLVTNESARAGRFGGVDDYVELTRLARPEIVPLPSKVGLDLLPYNLRQNHTTYARRAERQDTFVQPRGGEDPAGEHVGIEKETEPDGSSHRSFVFDVLALRRFRFARSGYSRA